MRPRPGLAGVLASTLLTLVFLRTLWTSFATAVPGALGDNAAFLWNTWWAGHAWRQFPAVLTTDRLFAPWGTSLVLNTHTLLASTLAAAVPGVIRGTNVIVALHVWLNALCAYALAYRFTRRILPAAIAAVVFAWSPYVAAHLAGHFNLIAAWVLPLFALLLMRAVEDDDRRSGLLCGVLTAAIAYLDYYYFVYAIALGLVILTHRACGMTLSQTARPRWQRIALGACAALLLIDVAILIGIAVTGGGRMTIAGAAISLRGIENPAAAAGLLVMLAVAIAVVPRARLSFDRASIAGDAGRLAAPCVIAAILLAPLVFAATSLWRQGGYVTQTYFWRSAPAGVDVGTLLLGNPGGALWTGVSADLYQRLGIERVEQVAWLGPALIALAAIAIRRTRSAQRTTLWITIGAVFALWALGPRLQAFGNDLHVFLPAVLLRYVPLASNARMPGRAIVLVYLALAMLAAIGAESLLSRGRRGVAYALAALLLVDFLPRAPELYRPERPAVYERLARASGPGAVCELPMGLRDGFGETGRLDMAVLYDQTLHGRPITGGFVARLDPRVIAAYQFDPVLGVLLRLSGGATLASQRTLAPQLASDSLRLHGIRFIVLNRRTAPPDLIRYVEAGLPLTVLEEDGDRTLYELTAPVNAAAERYQSTVFRRPSSKLTDGS